MVNGQRRVIIENIQPQVDNGRDPAKRTGGERGGITADIFADGHDHLRAEARYRAGKTGAWKSVAMCDIGNDRWQASFYVTGTGMYYFALSAWVDHFDTWYDGFRKKVAAKMDVKVELMEGAEYLRAVG